MLAVTLRYTRVNGRVTKNNNDNINVCNLSLWYFSIDVLLYSVLAIIECWIFFPGPMSIYQLK